MIMIIIETITGEPTHTASKQWHCMPHLCIYHLKRRRFVASTHCAAASTNQQLFKKNFCNQSSCCENHGRFPYKWKPSYAYHKIDTFVVSQDEWDTKEGTGKSMKNALHVQWCGKKYLSGGSDFKQ